MSDPDPIAPRQPLELDAAVAAHRRLLVLLFTLLGRDAGARAAIGEAISQQLSVHDADHDAHEDAGVDADAAFAFECRVDSEFRRILTDAAAALRASRGDADPPR